MTREQLYLSMNSIVRVATGVTSTMIADDSHGSPSGTYCSIEPFNSTVQRGQANVKVTTDLTTVKPQMITEVSFNFYRTGALQLANLLHQSNKRPDVQALLRANGLGWNRSSGVRNLTGRLADGNQEERAQISVFIMFEDSIDVTHNTITTVPFEIETIKQTTAFEVETSMGGIRLGNSVLSGFGEYVTSRENVTLTTSVIN